MTYTHMSPGEVAKIDSLQKKKKVVKQILKVLQKDRAKKDLKGPSRSAVYCFTHGETYKRESTETRGHPTLLYI